MQNRPSLEMRVSCFSVNFIYYKFINYIYVLFLYEINLKHTLLSTAGCNVAQFLDILHNFFRKRKKYLSFIYLSQTFVF